MTTLRTFTYWQDFELAPGLKCQIVRETVVTSEEAFYERIIETVKRRTNFSWKETVTETVNVYDAGAVPVQPADGPGLYCDHCARGYGELHTAECRRALL